MIHYMKLVLALLIAVIQPAIGAADSLAIEPTATRIVVQKQAHRLSVYQGDQAPQHFRVALGRGGLRPKRRQGDGRVPEGSYFISGRNADSAFHLSLRISYPTPDDAQAALARGDRPGGDIMIHGLPNGWGRIGARHRSRDWTDGCIAVTDQEIEWLWAVVPDGTPILGLGPINMIHISAEV